jgi:hypothetical protein
LPGSRCADPWDREIHTNPDVTVRIAAQKNTRTDKEAPCTVFISNGRRFSFTAGGSHPPFPQIGMITPPSPLSWIQIAARST